MITHSGIRVAPGTEEMPTPVDLAVHMGRITRFGGAIWCPLLMHSVLVGELTWAAIRKKGGEFDFQTWAWSLLHDGHETITGEIPRPWKTASMKDHQHRLDSLIAKAYRLDCLKIDFALIKVCDERALILEGTELRYPRFQEIYEKIELSGDKMPAISDDERRLAQALTRSEFWHAEFVTDPLSRPVAAFARILEHVQSGDLVGAAHLFRITVDRLVGKDILQ